MSRMTRPSATARFGAPGPRRARDRAARRPRRRWPRPVLGGAVVAAAPAALLPAWDGSIDLYRDGVFTTQKSWLWCTAAGVQIVRNIVERDDDHSTSGQRRYFDWMRRTNHYDLPESAGVDPQGWTAGLRHFVDDRYRLVASRSFDGGSAVGGGEPAPDRAAGRR